MITIGTPIIYTLSDSDAASINQRRQGITGGGGNPAQSGQKYPGIVVRDWSEESGAAGVDAKPNLQVWLDGNDALWVTSVEEDGSKSPKHGTFARR